MFFQSTAIVILLLFYGCYYMKLKIAFLQLLPGAAIEDNIEKGIKACREARRRVRISRCFLKCGAAAMYFHMMKNG